MVFNNTLYNAQLHLFSNVNLEPSRLYGHFNKQHGEVTVGHSLDTVKSRRSPLYSSGTLKRLCYVLADQPFLQASYEGAYVFANRKKLHTTAENSGKRCALQNNTEIRGTASAGILSSGMRNYQFLKMKAPRSFETSG